MYWLDSGYVSREGCRQRIYSSSAPLGFIYFYKGLIKPAFHIIKQKIFSGRTSGQALTWKHEVERTKRVRNQADT